MVLLEEHRDQRTLPLGERNASPFHILPMMHKTHGLIQLDTGNGLMSVSPPSFRLGSEAGYPPAPRHKRRPSVPRLQPLVGGLQHCSVPADAFVLSIPGKPSKPWKRFSSLMKAWSWVGPLAILCAMFGLLGHMQLQPHGGGGRGDVHHRIPPAWSPEGDSQYSFRSFMTDLSLWVMLTDLQPHQQCAAIILRLGGSARELARSITPQEVLRGGNRNGVPMDPVTYMLAALHSRFAALDEESRLGSMTEMLAFTRKPDESVSAVLARYEVVRQRAATEGNFVMNTEECALQILRACGTSKQQLYLLLQPFGGRLPTTDLQFQELCTQLRRFGRIAEGAPGNISTLLSGPMRQARPGSYYQQSVDAPDNSQQAFFGWGRTGSTSSVTTDLGRPVSTIRRFTVLANMAWWRPYGRAQLYLSSSTCLARTVRNRLCRHHRS